MVKKELLGLIERERAGYFKSIISGKHGDGQDHAYIHEAHYVLEHLTNRMNEAITHTLREDWVGDERVFKLFDFQAKAYFQYIMCVHCDDDSEIKLDEDKAHEIIYELIDRIKKAM